MIRRLPDLPIEPVVRLALSEDLSRAGDLTAQACIPEGARMRAVFAARQPGVLAGVDCVRLALAAMDAAASIDLKARDGDAFEAGAVLVEAEADARAFLAAERTALNLLGRLCGVATLTRAYVDAVAGTGARIADTRKTTPGLRALEKHAVACGGGMNHRFGLDDRILVKDNRFVRNGRSVEHRARSPIDFVNNVVYDWGAESGYSGPAAEGSPRLNYVANVLVAGPSTPTDRRGRAFHGGSAATRLHQRGNRLDAGYAVPPEQLDASD